ncbi:hypothetical protein KC19_5G088800 [Ceratodon purpureus]|uniref:Rhodanese domain-containing protein n=1 Tax=Ceratodon purpureus TaxID=3225 RepID=A0A8T0I0K0_CERPU|nr:hypothetical protein KC19_5G088800 [Ceratodon purpureus]
MAESESDEAAEWGVLLYYKFVPIADPAQTSRYFQTLCAALSLQGRLRVAPDGVNVTVTGTLRALHTHIAALHAHPRFAFPPIDFKLSAAPPLALVPPHLAEATGFAALSVRLVPHLITLAPDPPPISAAGPLVSPGEFHDLLQQPHPSCVLIDARNVYETRIGKFCPPPHVEFLDPLLRQYSDLPGWLDAHQEQLRNKRVLMYCTGGVRCELASSYLRSKGKDFEDVVQLSGGIHRYMEAFADGGYFKGKNFVFDHRLAVASSNEEVVGRCLLCNAPFDDYSARNRCSTCRLLVLICKSCQGAGDSSVSSVKYVCELCELNQKGSRQPQQLGGVCESIDDVPTTKHVALAADTETPILHEGRMLKPKLRLLCLHGFRQNASSFKGRLGSLKKKLKHVAEFVFVDAPHKLPFIQQERCEMGTAVQSRCEERRSLLNETSCRTPTWKYAWLVSPRDAYANESEDSERGEEPSSTWRATKTPFDAWQYETQTEGWDTSWEYLQKVFQDLGPFDGVLGFSQGASVAAALCQLRKTSPSDAGVNFKFAVLCSGYPPPLPFFAKGMASEAGIPCPSLHIYGGQDRQIHDHTSEQLSNMFQSEERTIVKHECGHIIPTQPAYIEQYVQFLSRFL